MSFTCIYDDGSRLYSDSADACPLQNSGSDLVAIDEIPDTAPAPAGMTITKDVYAPSWPEGLGWLAVIIAILIASRKKH